MADKLDMKSMDTTGDNIAKIRALFPSAVTEVMGDDGKVKLAIDFDALKQELSDELVSDKQERYQMTWPDKSKAKVLANSRITATLRPDVEKSVDFDTTENLYIEGDTVNGKTYYAVNDNDIIACFDDNIDNDVITAIAKQNPLYAVFKDKSFATDSVGINNEQLFKTYSPSTVVKVI